MKKDMLARLALIASMLIFGTVGLFRNGISMPSAVIALARGAIGALFLAVFRLLRGKGFDQMGIRKNLWRLLLSGGAMGLNWVLLFEAYNYTSIAVATLSYYMAPVLVILAAPLLLKEKLTLKSGLCALVALGGMIPVSGLLSGSLPAAKDAEGILFGLGAAVLYASVVLMNKTIKEIGAFDKTILQLGAAALVLIPYVAFSGGFNDLDWGGNNLWLLLAVAILHTGVAYALYFGSIGHLKASTAAILSYIDPVSAILLSGLLYWEFPGWPVLLGAVMILGAALVSELPARKK